MTKGSASAGLFRAFLRVARRRRSRPAQAPTMERYWMTDWVGPAGCRMRRLERDVVDDVVGPVRAPDPGGAVRRQRSGPRGVGVARLQRQVAGGGRRRTARHRGERVE